MCSLHEDRSGNIESLLRSVAGAHQEILDFGCGVGGYLGFLSENFRKVTGVDTSKGCVERAAVLAQSLPNVEVLSVRALRRSGMAGSFGAVLMANVLLSPDPAERQQILREAVRYLRPGGDLVLVVPAIESVHLAEAVRRRYRPRRRSSYSMPPAGTRFDPGVVCIHGQPTRHHSEPELAFELRQEGFSTVEFFHAEYTWASEGFDQLDSVVRERPWDWLVRARLPASVSRTRQRSGKAPAVEA